MKQEYSAGAGRTAEVGIQRARERDLDAIDSLYRELKVDEYEQYARGARKMRARFRRIARARDHHLMVAECAGRVVGTLHVLIFRHLGHGARPGAIVENVVVTEAMRSRGIGEALMKAARRIAQREGCYKPALTSRTHRKAAHRFYERLGYRH
jgi:GNAT superfamily N-acetyltransferase